jgi:amino acid transporter
VSLETLDPVTPSVVGAFGSWAQKPFEAVVLVAFIACAIAVQATATRVRFSLSRDRMLPASGVLRRVGHSKVPRAALAVAAVVSGCGLVFGLDTRAVNTLITFGSGGYYITFWLVCAGALWARLTGRWVPAGRSRSAAGRSRSTWPPWSG